MTSTHAQIPRTATQLLVSVRSAAEARLALAEGVRWLDVKEPAAGSLGAASTQTLAEIAAACEAHPSAATRPHITLSAALGELADYVPRPLPPPYRFAKLGLAGCAAQSSWVNQWRAALAELPPTTRGVAVIYADFETAAAPPPQEVVSRGVELNCSHVLIDTFDKTRGKLLDLWTWKQIVRAIDEVHAHGLKIVLAGSLTEDCLRKLLTVQPDVVAVRGAACGGIREQGLCAASVRRLVHLLSPPE